ncbi:hypothetical protein [Scytonema sp. PRP1]|uniref:hypothetical protein n=1 Tax=Scytonema sp. PRP1 TaxID=3120513 RepID=UPI002FD26FC1
MALFKIFSDCKKALRFARSPSQERRRYALAQASAGLTALRFARSPKAGTSCHRSMSAKSS